MSSPMNSISGNDSTNAGEAWDILCVLGQDGASQFSISVTKNITITQLKKAILQDCPDKLSGLGASDLSLHLVSIEGTVEDVDIEGSVSISKPYCRKTWNKSLGNSALHHAGYQHLAESQSFAVFLSYEPCYLAQIWHWQNCPETSSDSSP